MTNNLTNNVRNFIQFWNDKFPIDYWWRKKYSVPFGSPQHREMNFIDMKIEFEEDKMLQRIAMSKKVGKEKWEEINASLSPVNEKEIDEEFDNFDINNISE